MSHTLNVSMRPGAFRPRINIFDVVSEINRVQLVVGKFSNVPREIIVSGNKNIIEVNQMFQLNYHNKHNCAHIISINPIRSILILLYNNCIKRISGWELTCFFKLIFLWCLKSICNLRNVLAETISSISYALTTLK